MSNSNPNCWVKFYENDGGNGHHKKYDGPVQENYLQENWDDGNATVSGKMNSISTGSEGWVVLYDQDNCTGNSTIYNNNTNEKDLSERDRGSDENNWQNDVRSFILYDHPIVDTQPIVDIFFKGFKDIYNSDTYGSSNYDKDEEGGHINIYSQDGHFEVNPPKITQYADKMGFELLITHKKATADDTCRVNFQMDSTGKLVGDTFSIRYDMSSAKQIPEWVIKLADVTIDGAEFVIKLTVDCCEEIITEGLGTAAVPITNQIIGYAANALTFAVDHVNLVLRLVFKLEEDGSTLYFPSIVAHSIHRLMTAYVKYCVSNGTIQLKSGTSPTTELLVQYDDMPDNFDYKVGNWHSTNHNHYLEFYKGSNNYKVWMPDYSPGYVRSGMIVSLKIDSLLSVSSNDYAVINILFGPTGSIMALQGTVLYHKADEDSSPIGTGMITFNQNGTKLVQLTEGDDGHTQSKDLSGTDIETAYLTCFNNSFSAAAKGDYFDDGTRNLPAVSIDVIKAIKKSLAFKK